MSNHKNKPIAGLPEVAEPAKDEPMVVVLEVEKNDYQIEQEQVVITAVPPACPRCGSMERTPLKEISPRLHTERGLIIRYRTQCLGAIQPVDEYGKPIVNADGTPKTYHCGNRYKVKKLVLE